MRVHSIARRSSPRATGWHRLEASVAYDDGDSPGERYWLEVPDEYANSVVDTGDPWLAFLAPVAVTLGQPLLIDAPTSARMLDNVRHVARTWTSWFSDLRVVPLDATSRTEAARRASTPPLEHSRGRTASFFSGGVDSFHTALRHRPGGPTSDGLSIDALLFVWGFDIPLANDRAWATALASNCDAARELGLPLVPVVTNLRETRFATANWTRLSHGAALAGVAHALGGAFHTVLIPSSASVRDLRPWGSHPDTDTRFTSDRVHIVHDGVEWRRAEKTEYIATSEIALRHLRVCYRSADGTNCGRCKRCYRTMLALAAIGALERCSAFAAGALDLKRAGRLYCDDEPDMKQFGFVRELAVREGHPEIASAIDASFRRSTRMVRIVRALRWLRDRPLFWRWAPTWEGRLLRRWVV